VKTVTDGVPDVSKEAEVAAAWWGDVLRGEPTFSNGDPFAGALASAISDRQEDLPDEQIQAFEDELQRLIEDHLTDMLQDFPDYTMYVNTDYSPMKELAEAVAEAGIDAGMTTFPWKTGMWIEPGMVKVSDPSGHPSDEDGRAVIYAEDRGEAHA